MNIVPPDFKYAMNLEYGRFKWHSRILFLVIVVLNLLVNFNPYSSSDFTAFLDYLYSPELDYMAPEAIPITDGNIIYLLSIIGLNMLMAMIVGIFSGVLANKYDVTKDMVGEKKVNKIPLRKCIVWILFVILFTIPMVLSIVYSFIIMIFLMPGIVMLPSVYLNGDVNVFKSIGRTVRLLRRGYLKTLNVVILIYLSYYILNLLSMMLIYGLSSTAAYVLSAFAAGWCWTALGRYTASRYCVLKYMKGANPFQTPNLGQ